MTVYICVMAESLVEADTHCDVSQRKALSTLHGSRQCGQEEEEDSAYRPRSIARELIPVDTLSRRGWNPIKNRT